MNPYGEVIQDHSRHPRNYGALDAPDIRHEDENPLCGDRVRIEVSLAADDTVSAARFQGDLCMIARAAGSVLTEMITGLSLDGAGSVSERQLLEALRADIKPARRKCAILPLEVLRSGIDAYRMAK